MSEDDPRDPQREPLTVFGKVMRRLQRLVDLPADSEEAARARHDAFRNVVDDARREANAPPVSNPPPFHDPEARRTDDEESY